MFSMKLLLKYFVRGAVYSIAALVVFLLLGISLSLTNFEVSPLGYFVIPLVIVINGFLVTWVARI